MTSQLVVHALVMGLWAATPSERPWAAGVSAERQEQALQLFREGNEVFEQSKHALALTKYRDALKAWDHPAIRFNTAVALINLDQPLEALEHLDAAMRFGDQPFDAETWKQAQLYKRLLGGQVAELAVTCAMEGAEVSLDGERLFVGPGSASRRVKPGSHQVVAAKAGFVSSVATLTLEAGRPLTHDVRLVEQRANVRLVRRFPTWLPWTVMGGGVALIGAGVPFFASSGASYSAFDRDLARLCPSGCATSALPDTVLASRTTGQGHNVAAITLVSVGAATALAGVVLAVLNIPQPEALTVWLSPSGGALTLAW